MPQAQCVCEDRKFWGRKQKSCSALLLNIILGRIQVLVPLLNLRFYSTTRFIANLNIHKKNRTVLNFDHVPYGASAEWPIEFNGTAYPLSAHTCDNNKVVIPNRRQKNRKVMFAYSP